MVIGQRTNETPFPFTELLENRAVLTRRSHLSLVHDVRTAVRIETCTVTGIVHTFCCKTSTKKFSTLKSLAQLAGRTLLLNLSAKSYTVLWQLLGICRVTLTNSATLCLKRTASVYRPAHVRHCDFGHTLQYRSCRPSRSYFSAKCRGAVGNKSSWKTTLETL